MFKSLNVASRDEEEIDDFRDFDEETEAAASLNLSSSPSDILRKRSLNCCKSPVP